jgi:AcrR family transcriptional regulator
MREKRDLTLNTILDQAVAIVEQNGLDALNINTIAAALNVKPPSLYNHVSGIDELRRELLRFVLRRCGETVRSSAVGRSEENALREIAYAYRSFAREHPELYRVFVNAPKLDGNNELELIADTLRQVLSPFGLEPADEMNFIRLFHSSLHGFVSLENAGLFSTDSDIDGSFNALTDSFIQLIGGYKK